MSSGDESASGRGPISVPDAEKRPCADHASAHELRLVGQPEVGITAVGQERVADGPATVAGGKPCVLGTQSEPAGNQLGELHIESAIGSLGSAERQIVRVGAHSQGVGRDGRAG